MRYGYLVLAFLLGLAGPRAQAQATLWRPFRPGLVYSFSQLSSTTTPTPVHTLRVDSAYATTGGDSVYTFNRLLRHPTPSSYSYLKSRNNLFGARLRWRPGTSDYYLEANVEPTLSGPATPVVLLLRPRAAVGSTWSASSMPALSATLSSRALGTVGDAPDSVATITLSNGQVLTLSRHYGLVAGPQWLTLASGATLPATWQLALLPQAGLGSYDPRVLFKLDVGDELGYAQADIEPFSPSCYTGYRLRRILGRQQTADSLIYTYNEQEQLTYTGFCGAPGPVLSPVKQQRWAFSLRTGGSAQFPYLALLTGEYRLRSSTNPTILYVGQGYTLQVTTGDCLMNRQALSFLVVYGTTSYQPGVDFGYIKYTLSASLGVGLAQSDESPYISTLTYFRRGSVACGQAANYATLLPSRAALATAAATLHPNPTTGAAMLTLASPAQAGTTLALTDALGRRVWSAPVAAGQAALPVSLASQPTGLYLVQLLVPGAAPLTWKLIKE